MELHSPSVRKAMSPNMRQSWILNSPIANSEAEKTIVQPTPILENRRPTAMSRLSIFIQKGPIQTKPNGNGSNNSINGINGNGNVSSPSSSPSIGETISPETQLSDNYSPLSPALTNTYSTTNVYGEYDISSESSHSLSSSLTSTSMFTNRPDSMCDTASTLSASPCQSEFNYKNHQRKSSFFHNSSQQQQQQQRHINNVCIHANNNNKNINANTQNRRHRFSVPTVSQELATNNSTPRRASLPIIHSNDSNASISSNDVVEDTIAMEMADDHLNQDLVVTTPQKVSTLSKSQFNEKISRASIKMSINKLMQKRLHVALEILTTERHYVECLLLVQKLFLNPLLQSLSTPNPILNKKTINKIFANILDLISVNSELLKRLEERVFGTLDADMGDDKFWNPEDGCLGDIFFNMAPFFKMYSIYVKNFNSALAVIDKQLRDNPMFSSFLRDVIKTGQCKGLTLQAYLIMPVQRIPRYKLLLEDLLKKTPESHPDYLNLKKAHNVIDNVATFVNETIRQHEMFITMLEIQRFLTGFDEAVLIPGRTFIKRGKMRKVCRKSLQEREFFLFSDILIYASLSLIDNTFTFHRKFDLENVTVLENTVVKEVMSNGFQIITPQKSFTIYSDTEEEKISWINAIRNAKEEFLSAKRTLKIDNDFDSERKDLYKKRIVENYHAPIWVPDSKADKCMNCSDEFTLFRRKHHCRACGRVVCHACSTRNFVIPGSSEREDQWARACDPCFFTMFPDALRDEDLAPGIHVWDFNISTGFSRSNNSSSHGRENSLESVNGGDNNKVIKRELSGGSGILISQIKSIHEAIVAKRCELCTIDFGVFRWRNVCVKCRKIVCTSCLTKKPIDLSLIPKDFLIMLMEDPQLQQQQNRLSNRFSTTNIIRLCDFCYLDIDPDNVTFNEESDGGWAAKGDISPT